MERISKEEEKYLRKSKPDVRHAYEKIRQAVLSKHQGAVEFYATEEVHMGYIGIRDRNRYEKKSIPFKICSFYFRRNYFHLYVLWKDYRYDHKSSGSVNGERKDRIKKIVKHYKVEKPNKGHHYWYVNVTDGSHIGELLEYMKPIFSDLEPIFGEESQTSGFSFVESGSGKKVPSKERETKSQTIQTEEKHEKIKYHLRKRKIKEHGEDNVKREVPSGNGQFIDLVVRKDSKYWFYEIKTQDNDRLCIREAIGQLLEYSYWPGCEVAERLIVAGEPKLTKDGEVYLKALREKLRIPVYYEQVT